MSDVWIKTDLIEQVTQKLAGKRLHGHSISNKEVLALLDFLDGAGFVNPKHLKMPKKAEEE